MGVLENSKARDGWSTTNRVEVTMMTESESGVEGHFWPKNTMQKNEKVRSGPKFWVKQRESRFSKNRVV